MWVQEKRNDEIELLEGIVSQYKGAGDLIQRVQQGKSDMQKRADAILQQIIALEQRVKETQAHQGQEAERLVRRQQERRSHDEHLEELRRQKAAVPNH